MTSEKAEAVIKEVDLYRDTPVRYLGYANEVGEAFRAFMPVNVVRLTYVVSSAYVVADASSKGQATYKKFNENLKEKIDELQSSSKTEVGKEVATVVLDTFIWQAFASVIIPGFTINRICYANNKIFERFTKLPVLRRKLLVTSIGLASIPIIIKPIDHFVDWAMDNTFRKMFKK